MFKKCDVVNLLSDKTTPMTVESITESGVVCAWLDINKHLQTATFNCDLLEPHVSFQDKLNKLYE